MKVAQSRAADGFSGEGGMRRLAELRILHEQIYRWRHLTTISHVLGDRYPELGPMLADMHNMAFLHADIEIRRELAGVETFDRTRDFDSIPGWVQQRWNTADDSTLAQAYVRYMAAGAGAAYTGPDSLAGLVATRTPRHQTIVWGENP
ncbi:hypothetical protein [Nocardia sp. NPDC004722]